MKKYFYIEINEDDNTGMDAISLVESPAVQHNFLCFSQDIDNQQLIKLSNDEKHIISGVVCLADTPIYRYDESIGEYYVIFSQDTIEKMMLKYFKNNLINNVNLQHEGELVEGITMIESYIKDENRGISPIEFKDVPNGSWMATFKVQNDELWNEIKNSGKLNGFSLLGIFDICRYTPKTEDKYSEEKSLDEQLEELVKNLIK